MKTVTTYILFLGILLHLSSCNLFDNGIKVRVEIKDIENDVLIQNGLLAYRYYAGSDGSWMSSAIYKRDTIPIHNGVVTFDGDFDEACVGDLCVIADGYHSRNEYAYLCLDKNADHLLSFDAKPLVNLEVKVQSKRDLKAVYVDAYILGVTYQKPRYESRLLDEVVCKGGGTFRDTVFNVLVTPSDSIHLDYCFRDGNHKMGHADDYIYVDKSPEPTVEFRIE